MTQITCTIHGRSTVEPKFLDCPWCLESTITTQSAALRMAVEALEEVEYYNDGCGCCMSQKANDLEVYKSALTACREAMKGDHP